MGVIPSRHPSELRTQAPTTLSLPPSLVPFLAGGTIAVVAGGLVAAATGPAGWDRGTWAAAFLVLVAGVGQIGLGAGQAILADVAPSGGRLAREVVLLDVGSALVLAGGVASAPAVVTAGSLVLAAALVAFALVPRRHGDWRPWLGRAYTGLLVVLLVSTPIGLALAWMRT
jgi:hypothetical protein